MDLPKFYDITAVVSGCIENSDAFAISHECMETFLFQCFDLFLKCSVFFLCHLIYFMDRRSRQNIMELVDQDFFPHAVEFFCRIRCLCLC